ncbi:hypothetical protein A2344_01620 [Candidatus Peregrinibacteria bacterium RIFOXYB12_FULL_41_12]|nr:MAG: hypothetical protein A2244_04315 [Candidatus Peregrinibacteria bacterium RIFOXYA2_FULL_41_18]OGJ48808.1 MAG: hypothetical protein A2344_01620 [Candidatus Peregrinibacteria bacterium RIFOXYB12_FULL_41_12]
MEKLSNSALWSLCQKYGGLALAYRKKFVALLPEVEKRKLYKKYGFCSIYEFAARVGGVSERVVDEVLRLNEKVSDKPLLNAQIAEVGWSKVAIVAPIVTKENETKIVEMVKSLPQPALKAYVSQIKTVDESAYSRKPTVDCNLQSVTFKLDQETQFLLHKYQQKLERENGEPMSLGKVLKTLLKQVDQPIKEPQKRESHTRKPSAYDRFRHDNGGKCAFPNCNNPHEIFHRPNRYALDPSHENITPLCQEHHALAHAGLIVNEQSPPSEWHLRNQMQLNSIDRKYQEHVIYRKHEKFISKPDRYSS